MNRFRAVRRPSVPVGAGSPSLLCLVAATAPGNGVSFNLGRSYRDWTTTVTVTGAPASFSVQPEGSLDGVTWTNVGTAITAAGSQTTLGVPFTWFRCVLGSLTGGTNPTVTALVAGY